MCCIVTLRYIVLRKTQIKRVLLHYSFAVYFMLTQMVPNLLIDIGRLTVNFDAFDNFIKIEVFHHFKLLLFDLIRYRLLVEFQS